MKKEEVKITSFQAENYRLQLLYITKEMKNGTIKKIYEVRENRKVICSNVTYDNAKTVFSRCINDKLNINVINGPINEPKTIIKSLDNKYYRKDEITKEELEEYIKSGKYNCVAGTLWLKK